MGKEDKQQVTVEKPPSKAWVHGIAGWFIPGLGHALQGKWGRAAILGGSVWASFVAGLWMGGRLYRVTGGDQSTSVLMQIPPMIANLGAGILYVACWFVGVGFSDDAIHAARATYEYGNTFLLIAGLLNYLVMLDAFDLSSGRKA